MNHHQPNFTHYNHRAELALKILYAVLNPGVLRLPAWWIIMLPIMLIQVSSAWRREDPIISWMSKTSLLRKCRSPRWIRCVWYSQGFLGYHHIKLVCSAANVMRRNQVRCQPPCEANKVSPWGFCFLSVLVVIWIIIFPLRKNLKLEAFEDVVSNLKYFSITLNRPIHGYSK